MYTYEAIVINVYDGDTIDVKIDLGFKINKETKIRLEGINAPEIRGKQRKLGLISKDYLSNLILGKNVTIVTNKDKTGKYGRYIATIYLGTLNVNKHLLNKGYAMRY